MENNPPYENPVVVGHPALREVSTPVTDGSELPSDLIRTMNWIAMEDKRKKIHSVSALSAPQLGVNKRIIGIGLYHPRIFMHKDLQLKKFLPVFRYLVL